MMSRHFDLSSELNGAIAKRLPHAKISFLGLAVSSINSLQIYSTCIYIYSTQTNINRVLIVRMCMLMAFI